MTKKTDNSQSHKNEAAPGFDPMAGFSRMSNELLAHMAQLSEEAARWEKQAIDRTARATEEVAELARQTLSYWGNMAAQLRETALESARRTSERFSRAG